MTYMQHVSERLCAARQMALGGLVGLGLPDSSGRSVADRLASDAATASDTLPVSCKDISRLIGGPYARLRASSISRDCSVGFSLSNLALDSMSFSLPAARSPADCNSTQTLGGIAVGLCCSVSAVSSAGGVLIGSGGVACSVGRSCLVRRAIASGPLLRGADHATA